MRSAIIILKLIYSILRYAIGALELPLRETDKRMMI